MVLFYCLIKVVSVSFNVTDQTGVCKNDFILIELRTMITFIYSKIKKSNLFQYEANSINVSINQIVWCDVEDFAQQRIYINIP